MNAQEKMREAVLDRRQWLRLCHLCAEARQARFPKSARIDLGQAPQPAPNAGRRTFFQQHGAVLAQRDQRRLALRQQLAWARRGQSVGALVTISDTGASQWTDTAAWRAPHTD